MRNREHGIAMACLLSGKCKTSDFFEANLRTFNAKPPYFLSKKSDVLHFPDHRISPPSTKKVFENLLHFLHHSTRSPVFTDNFG